ncbi:MAG: acyl-CoA thioesterase [Planctomycetota bacterium]|nr:MAG: acyl-CoA thioesterase [Planctomycetota bacterium]
MEPKPPAPNPAYPAGVLPAIRRVMTPQDTNAMGTVFGGAILSDIDLAAAIAAHRHHCGNVVTVAMDRIEFLKPVFVGDVLTIFATTSKLGRSSITVEVKVFAERRLTNGETVKVTQAEVTMVAVDEELRPIPVKQPC